MPLPYHGQFLLLELIDVRREPVLPSGESRATYEQVVFARKAKAHAREFIGSVMKPLDVRIRPAPYTTLRAALLAVVPGGSARGEPPRGAADAKGRLCGQHSALFSMTCSSRQRT